MDETARCLSSGDPENLIDLNSEYGPAASLAMRQHIVKDLEIVRDRIDRIIETNWHLS